MKTTAMNKILITLALLFSSSLLMADAQQPSNRTVIGETCQITVRVAELQQPEGLLGVALYTTKKGFPDKPDRAWLSTVKKLDGSMPEFVFENIPYGTYAVSVLHDKNSNGKMDKTFIGIPKEGFGVSNNPKIKYGPPSFSEAEFTVQREHVELIVAMNYFKKDKDTPAIVN
jgi:uncharacterized protein (DUF2141 family)